MMAGNSVLNKSKSAKNNDEFYTTYETIKKELEHYEYAFDGKVVLCNCDDPFESNFSKYFLKNFNRLHIKKLICTSYADSKIEKRSSSVFSEEHSEKGIGYVLVVTKVPKKINENTDDEQILDFIQNKGLIKLLNGSGDFRSDECVDYLKKADIVVTNPPFSLFRELISLIIDYKKQFLVIGNANAITYKEIFPMIQNNKMWLGYQFGDMEFRVPEDSEARNTRFWIDESGQKWRSLGNAMWLTNIDINRRHIDLELTHRYDPAVYPRFDLYDAIEVSKVATIPMDYDGIMAVPITFLNKHNPDQFEIIGEANHGSDNPFDLFKPTINGKLVYKRILIRRK